MSWLSSQLGAAFGLIDQAAGEPIIYRRGSAEVEIECAVRGESRFEEVVGDGETTTLIKSVDWLVKPEDLVICGDLAEPMKGDQVITADGEVFDLMPGMSESPWRWLNSYKTRYRIHTVKRR